MSGRQFSSNRKLELSSVFLQDDAPNPTLSRRYFSGGSRDAPNYDPLGLKVVYRPPSGRRVDIVFVHGLGGSSRMTWSKNRDLNNFWPQNFLPYEPVISEARILTFGYNANFGSGSDKILSLLDFAKSLLYDLKYAQDESGEKLEGLQMGEHPIIFVVHSVGGLIVKEAFMQGQSDPQYDAIIKAVSSIIFLSTPHRGANMAETMNRILHVTSVTSSKQFIFDLASSSQMLEKVNEQFRHVAAKLQIVSFYETRPTIMRNRTETMVLERDSSVLGYPGEISKPLDADHYGICKYESPDDPRYIIVRDILKALVEQATLKDYKAVGDDIISQIKKLRSYLGVSESQDRDYNFFRDHWSPGTCDWILKDTAFRSWAEDRSFNPRVLWMNGSPASGKSVMSSFIIDHLVRLDLSCSYFFFRFSSQEGRSLGVMLRSLAYQMASSIPAYADEILRLEAAGNSMRMKDHRSLWRRLFKQALFSLLATDPLFWVIDGVDEANDSASLLELLSELHQVDIPLRVMVVSRKTPDIAPAIQRLANKVQLDTITIDVNHQVDDVRSYIDHALKFAGNEDDREDITQKLLRRAQGNFLWLHLAVRELNTLYTKLDVEEALNELPSGMEDLYHRMAQSVQTQARPNDRKLGLRILGWTTCATRLLSVDELSDALAEDGLLDIRRTIDSLCGNFVTVNHEEKVSLIHESARQYLTGGSGSQNPVSIVRKSTNEILLRRCIARLTDRRLRSLINGSKPPALLEYASSAWAHHLFHSDVMSLAVLELVAGFLGSPHVLTWIYAAARARRLRDLVTASGLLADIAIRTQRHEEGSTDISRAVAVIEGWATDLVKVVGKFGNNLIDSPDSIYKLIPPFCPEKSLIYQQFGRKERPMLWVSGLTQGGWDDCLASFPVAQGAMATCILTAGDHIAVLSSIGVESTVRFYHIDTFEERRQIVHRERVLKIQISKMGDLLVTYGYLTTKIWIIATAKCLKTVNNPPKRPRPQSIVFTENTDAIIVCYEDRDVKLLSLTQDAPEGWVSRCQISEQGPKETMINLPTCSALSPDGSMVAFGYRNHPATAWQLESTIFIGHWDNIWSGVTQLAWHPFNDEVFGINHFGLLFRWDLFSHETSVSVDSGGTHFTVSCDGSLVATGNPAGTMKVFATADFSVLYQLISQDPILHLSFSSDSRRLYDARGQYCNVWEPNVLVRLADSSDDNNSESQSESKGMSKVPPHTEHNFASVDRIIALAAPMAGPLYCYCTEDGAAMLGEVGRGKVERLKSFMSIDHITWSNDGRFIALLHLSGRLSLRSVSRSAQYPSAWEVKPLFDLNIKPQRGPITQLFFHPTGKKLFASSRTSIFSVDLDSHVLSSTELDWPPSNVKWACHPTVDSALIAFGSVEAHLFSWNTLKVIEAYTYFPPRTDAQSVSAHSPQSRTTSFQNDVETLGKLTTSTDSPQVLLEVNGSEASHSNGTKYLLFDLNSMLKGTEQGERILHYTALQPEIAGRIYEPLAFLPQGRLVFIDNERWICTINMPKSESTMRPAVRKASEASFLDIEPCYFLPRDWVTQHDARLCMVKPDGTLLCPRNGQIVCVRAAQLMKFRGGSFTALKTINLQFDQLDAPNPAEKSGQQSKIVSSSPPLASRPDVPKQQGAGGTELSKATLGNEPLNKGKSKDFTNLDLRRDHHDSPGEYDHPDIPEELRDDLRLDDVYPSGRCWTCTPPDSISTDSVPLRIGGIPVVIPVESYQPPRAPLVPPSDPHPRFIDPTLPLVDEIIAEIFSVYEQALGFYLLINGYLQIIVPDDFDHEYALSHRPRDFGGLAVSYIPEGITPTANVTRNSSLPTQLAERLAGASASKTSLTNRRQPGGSSTIATPTTANLTVGGTFHAVVKNKETTDSFAGRVGVMTEKGNNRYITIPTHVMTAALLATKSSSFPGSSWINEIKVLTGNGNKELGPVSQTYDPQAQKYPIGFDHDISLIDVTSTESSLISDVKAGRQIEWLQCEEWFEVKIFSTALFLLSRRIPADTKRPRVKSIGLQDTSCAAVGQAILKKEAPPKKSWKSVLSKQKEEPATKWRDMVSKSVLFRVEPGGRRHEFETLSGTAVCMLKQNDDGTDCTQVIGFASFYQGVDSVQRFNVPEKNVEDGLLNGRVAFHAAFQLPKELTEHIIL